MALRQTLCARKITLKAKCDYAHVHKNILLLTQFWNKRDHIIQFSNKMDITQFSNKIDITQSWTKMIITVFETKWSNRKLEYLKTGTSVQRFTVSVLSNEHYSFRNKMIKQEARVSKDRYKCSKIYGLSIVQCLWEPSCTSLSRSVPVSKHGALCPQKP